MEFYLGKALVFRLSHKQCNIETDLRGDISFKKKTPIQDFTPKSLIADWKVYEIFFVCMILADLTTVTCELHETWNSQVLECYQQTVVVRSYNYCDKECSKEIDFSQKMQERIILYKAYIRHLLECDSHLSLGVWRLQKTSAFRLIGDSTITDQIDTLELHRKVGAFTLFYGYRYRICSTTLQFE